MRRFESGGVAAQAGRGAVAGRMAPPPGSRRRPLKPEKDDRPVLVRCRSCGQKFETRFINSKCPGCQHKKVKGAEDEATTEV